MQPIEAATNDSISVNLPEFTYDTPPSQTRDFDRIDNEISTDTIAPTRRRSDALDARVEYSAQDSIVFLSNGTMFLHGAGDVRYTNIRLQAEFIRVNLDSSLIFARGVVDSIGNMVGEPLFSDGGDEFEAREMTYNIRTRRGFVRNAITQQGEGFIISDKTVLRDDDLLAIAGARYTTCENHDDPHFYLRIQRGIVQPGSHIISGPAQLVMLGVPTPVAIPFGFFPFSDTYSSGFLMPSFVDELNRGLGLVNGGYYFAFNDFVDMELRTEIYTRGTWAASLASRYIVRYRFTGNVSVNYREDVMGERDMPDYQRNRSLAVNWTHQQDPRMNPYRTLSARVNFTTSGFNQNNINTYNNPAINSQNTATSSINLTQRFPTIPLLSLSGGMQITQVTRDSTISLSLPNLNIGVSRFFPFKNDNRVGPDRWFERIAMSYSGNLINNITTRQDMILQSSLMRDWQNGMQHRIPITASFQVFNHITVTPAINYSERWHTSSIRRSWDDQTNSVVTDTIFGFNRNFDFNGSVTAQTRIIGFYVPSRRIFGDRVDRIRHVMTPSVGFSYSPDFSDPFWGFWDSYIVPDPMGPYPGWHEVRYSRFDNTRFRGPAAGAQGNINFSLANNIEMRVRNRQDENSEQSTFRIVSLIDNFSVSGSYNIMADSMNLSNINANLRLRLGNRTLNLSGAFNPYMFKIDNNGRVFRSADYTWQHGMFPHFLGTSTSYTVSINNDTFRRLGDRFTRDRRDADETPPVVFAEDDDDFDQQPATVDRRVQTRERAEVDRDGFERVNIPFNINISYSLNYRPSNVFNENTMRYKMMFSHSMQLSANVSLTNNWRFSGNTSFDFEARQFTQMNINATRHLCCWTMTASFVPFGRFKSYHFRIGVNASMLQDLKYERRARNSTNPMVWL